MKCESCPGVSRTKLNPQACEICKYPFGNCHRCSKRIIPRCCQTCASTQLQRKECEECYRAYSCYRCGAVKLLPTNGQTGENDVCPSCEILLATK